MKKVSNRLKAILTDVLGVLLMVIAPFLGWLPGPGGIPLFLAGLGLLAINHEWARKWLKDFDKKRLKFTEKYLLGNPLIRWTLDVAAVIAFATGIWLMLSTNNLVLRGAGTAMLSLSIIVILINQKRFDRLMARFKNKS
jgi:uncharacterized membrane protein